MASNKSRVVAAALLGALGVSSCTTSNEESLSSRSEASQEPLGYCRHGMTTTLRELDPSAPRCSLGEVPDMVKFACETSDEVCEFLWHTLDGRATLQCSPYVTEGGSTEWCVDVVDRYLDGTGLDAPDSIPTRNYFIAYADDTSVPPSEDRLHWDAALGDPACIEPPTELSVAGYLTTQGFSTWWDPIPADPLRVERVFKFDPRECAGCAPYAGPSFDLISPEYQELARDGLWWPTFIEGSCEFTREPSELIQLDFTQCQREAMYWRTRR